MKKTLFLLITGVALFAACEDKNDDRAEELAQANALYQSALELTDYGTAIVALNQLVLMDSNNLEHKDSLARLFIKSGNMAGGVKLGQAVLDSNKGDNALKELMAYSYQQLAQLDQSIALFDELFASTNNYLFVVQNYQNMMFKGNAMRIDSMTTALLELSETNADAAATLIQFNAPLSNSVQYIPLKPAVLCLRGQYALNYKNEVAVAVKYFKKAIKEAENFETPYYELQRIGRAQGGI